MITCFHCKGHNVMPARQRNSNGAFHILQWCFDCNRCASPKTIYISKALIPGWEVLPIVVDYLDQAPPCEVCGSLAGTELHHWAPRHIFGDRAEQYPKSWLCKACHDEWHRTMAAHLNDNCLYCKRLANENS